MPRRELPEVSAGSMADIAFTLLIFFLVSTTLATDKGEKVSLPKWNPDQQAPDIEVNERNVFAIDIRKDGSLAVEGQNFEYRNLEKETVKFLTNNRRNPLYSDSYNEGIVNIRMHPDAPYGKYLEAYSNVKKAVGSIRDEYAKKKYGKTFDSFTKDEEEARKDVKKKYPLKLAEKMMDENDLKK